LSQQKTPFQPPCPPRGIQTVSPTRLKCRYSGYRLPPQLPFFSSKIQSFELTAVASVTDSRSIDGDPVCRSRKRLSCWRPPKKKVPPGRDTVHLRGAGQKREQNQMAECDVIIENARISPNNNDGHNRMAPWGVNKINSGCT
jgi:hypothetical protein